jgi:lipopolysaccharide export system permease protein
MKTLHVYLTRQVLATLVMTVAVFTFILLLGNALKEILVLLINRQATVGMVLEAFALLVPWVLAFALPMGMLTAALLVFGRFSADQELTAVRSSGISLVALISPILLLSLFLCGVSALINMEIAPRCRVAYIGLIDRTKAKMTSVIIPEERFIKTDHNIIYVGRNDGHNLKEIYIYKLDDEQKNEEWIFAPRGRLQTTNREVCLYLEEASVTRRNGDTWVTSTWAELKDTLGAAQTFQGRQKPGLSDMTFRQLQAELKELEGSFSLPSSRALGSAALREQLAQLAKQKLDMTMPVHVQIHRQVAFSFACLGFTLVGIPLGIRAHRRETNIGIAIALGLVLIYYCFTILGQSLQTHSEWAPHLIVWLPNFIFQSVGAVMLWRANRGI